MKAPTWLILKYLHNIGERQFGWGWRVWYGFAIMLPVLPNLFRRGLFVLEDREHELYLSILLPSLFYVVEEMAIKNEQKIYSFSRSTTKGGENVGWHSESFCHFYIEKKPTIVNNGLTLKREISRGASQISFLSYSYHNIQLFERSSRVHIFSKLMVLHQSRRPLTERFDVTLRPHN